MYYLIYVIIYKIINIPNEGFRKDLWQKTDTEVL